ncbi:hypothetical protein [Asticcacaulis taihuensis]|uniref:hypothetical protein n=1 Tax=Asticcacaulis taihuensis TaxID=260084 RepID=UPI0026EA1419|nr:hypothetical protein [Asticcacaulis taihuensis]
MTDETQAGAQGVTTEPAAQEATSTTQPTNSNWLDGLPEAYRANPSITRYDGLESLLKGVDGYAKHFGVPADQILRLPPKDATPEAMSEFYGRLGRPETPEAYAFNGIDLKNEGDKAFAEGFRADAHRLGFTQTQMDGIMSYLGSSITTVDQQIEAQLKAHREATAVELKTAWGEKYDIYQNEIPAVFERLAAKAGMDKDAALKAFNEGGFADNAAVMKVLAVMADMTAEGGPLPGQGRAEIAGEMSYEQALIAKKAFSEDAAKQAALHNAADPKHVEAIAERNRLNAIIAKGA